MKKILSITLMTLTMTTFVACGQTGNQSTNINNESPLAHSSNETLTPTKPFLIPSETPNMQTATQLAWRATLDSQYATSNTNTEATGVAAVATLRARNIICMDGYYLPLPFHLAQNSHNIEALDDHWVVAQCLSSDNAKYKGYTLFVNHDGSVIWKISYEVFNLPEHYEFLTGREIDFTGEYLYLNPSNLFQGSGFSLDMFFGYGAPLYKLSLKTGEMIIVLPELENGYYEDRKISPDNHYVVWSDSVNTNIIYFLDLVNNIKTEIKTEDLHSIVGAFTWRPDSKVLIFAAGVKGWEDEKAGISIFRLNIETMHLQILVKNDKRNLVPWGNSETSQVWQSDNVIYLASIQPLERNFSVDELVLNIETGQIIQLATPTPTSTP